MTTQERLQKADKLLDLAQKSLNNAARISAHAAPTDQIKVAEIQVRMAEAYLHSVEVRNQ